MEPKRITPRSPRAAIVPERVPGPSKRSRGARNPLVIAGNAIFTTLILVAIVGGIGLVVGKHRFEARGPLEQDKTVNIPKNLGVREIADLLAREGVIDEPWVFIGGVVVNKAREDLKFGEYQFTKGSSVQDVLATIAKGKVVQHQVTIPEGLTSQQIIQRLTEIDTLTGALREIPAEGSMLPESYRFTRGMPREQVVQLMQQAQKRVLQEIWDRRTPDLPVKTPEQLVILASVIEKETGKSEERTRVAAVFVNRLKQKMKLQSDPTIIYGLVGGRGSLGRPIQRNEITQPTPYNTYVIEGLPPGPIANPGRASLEAAANPARTRELFFVADGTGGHTFSENLDQHNRAVARLRAIERGETATPAPAVTTPAPTTTEPAPAQQPANTNNNNRRQRGATAAPAPRAQ